MHKLVMVSIQYTYGRYRTMFVLVPVDSDGKARVSRSTVYAL